MLGGGQKLFHQVRVRALSGLDPHLAAHRLKPHGDRTIHHQRPANIQQSADIDLQRIKCDREAVRDDANGRVKASGERGAQQVARVRSIMISGYRAMNSEWPYHAIILTARNDGSMEWIGLYAVDRACTVCDQRLCGCCLIAVP